MGDIIPFRRRQRRSVWTRIDSYRPPPGKPPRKPPPPARMSAWERWRPFILLVIFLSLIGTWQGTSQIEPPAWLQSAPRHFSGSFTICAEGRNAFCVIDGDTFDIGEERFRVVGIDTAEKEARCPAEAAQAAASTMALRRWLNRGDFMITTRLDRPTDRYGRTLAIVTRPDGKGGTDRLAAWMQVEGGARSYSGGFRRGWC